MTCKTCQGEPSPPGFRACGTCAGTGQVCDGCKRPIDECDGYCLEPFRPDEAELTPPQQQRFARGGPDTLPYE